jgi:hypothetical protein
MTEPTNFILVYKNGDAWIVAPIDTEDRNQKQSFRTLTDQRSALTVIALEMEKLEDKNARTNKS